MLKTGPVLQNAFTVIILFLFFYMIYIRMKGGYVKDGISNLIRGKEK